MSRLKDILLKQVLEEGPISIAQYMSQCLLHPEYGYYTVQNPFGRSGDFTTAPEISQIFGECVAAWILNIWEQLGKPEHCTILECGPGRGVLMQDILRSTRRVSDFQSSIHIVLLEAAQKMQNTQQEALSDFDVPLQWIKTLDACEPKGPIIILGNEFLDALPFRQYIWKDRWFERKIDIKDKNFVWNEMETDFVPYSDRLPQHSVFEVSEARERFCKKCAAYIAQNKGAALLIDYAFDALPIANSFQAIYKGQKSDPLQHPGESDLTSLVDFQAIKEAVDMTSMPVQTQSAFLQQLGAAQRHKVLMSNASPSQQRNLNMALERLLSPHHMGQLFKVLSFYSDGLNPAGFVKM